MTQSAPDSPRTTPPLGPTDATLEPEVAQFIQTADDGTETAPPSACPDPRGEDRDRGEPMAVEPRPTAQPVHERIPHPIPEQPIADIAVGSPAVEPASVPTPCNEAGDPLVDRLDVIERNLADILAATATFRAHSDFYEDLVRKQQQRIETLQTDQIQALLGPILQGLAALLTQASDAANRALARGDDRQVFDDFVYFHDAVEQALGLVGVNSVRALPGSEFDRAIHAARRSIDTPDEALGGTIARVMRQGLVREGGERAFLPAQVSVYRYKAPDPVVPEADLFPNFGTDANQRGDNA